MFHFKAAGEEPEWQDVLTDALLQLLLQTGHFWRECVNLVTYALIPHLRTSNLEQILEVLNMNKNPLSKKNDDDEEESDEEEEEEVEKDSSDDSDEEDSDDDGEEEDDDEDGGEDEEESHLAQIRESVRQALVAEGEAEDDASSVDWNDVDEEQGQRLNAALERSFQLFKPKSGKSLAKQKPTKSERIDNTSLLHFRIRALDLLDLFSTQKPTQAVILDVLLCVFQVFSHTITDTKLQSLREASLKLLKKLLTKNIDFESKPDKAPILEAIEQLMSTGEEQVDEDQDKKKQPQSSRQSKAEVTVWRDKCFAYLVSQGSLNEEPKKSAVWPLLVEFLELWVANRRSRLSLASFEALFQAGQWAGVAPLAVLLVSHLDVAKTRSLRRAQILKLLGEQFRRLEAAFQDADASNAKEFEKQLARYVAQLEKSDKNSPKELQLLQKILAQGGEKRAQLLEKVKVLAKKPQKKVNGNEQEADEEMEVDEEEEEEEKKAKQKKKPARKQGGKESAKKGKKAKKENEDEDMEVEEDEEEAKQEEEKALKKGKKGENQTEKAKKEEKVVKQKDAPKKTKKEAKKENGEAKQAEKSTKKPKETSKKAIKKSKK